MYKLRNWQMGVRDRAGLDFTLAYLKHQRQEQRNWTDCFRNIFGGEIKVSHQSRLSFMS